ncbi:hypothetical protein A3D03_02935 [Candidatus Gottesmanbacteria bacterium RIFCSPHIGHO2_02_FULL_40_13]|uniref:PIN domain-containing protein n=1 Tax=Candidatus Gottesmanbacteria bacterium RIFCSPHIGHO2_02_FULL_40_13 TaxID=1798384 RepID=A0A1F6A9H9_9BACT|nr:MAG: hypothetical protein A3D03_02935 [Candidatus Gottesmanbacteria bacterium RIFCSPHIGHO2_02_FULL_40_13]
MHKVFVDTSAWIAYFSRDDAHHAAVFQAFNSAIEEKSVICTSNYVFDETVTRLLYDASWNYTSKFINFITQSVTGRSIVKLWVDEQIEVEALGVVEKYHEHKLSFTDATTVVLVKNFKIDSILSLDSDFVKLGLSVLPA